MVDSNFIPKPWYPNDPPKKLPNFRKSKPKPATSDTLAHAMAVDDIAICHEPGGLHDSPSNGREISDCRIFSESVDHGNPGPSQYPHELDAIPRHAPSQIQGRSGDESTSRRGLKPKTKPIKHEDTAKGSLDEPKHRRKVAGAKKKDLLVSGKPDRWRAVSPPTHKDTHNRRPLAHKPRIWASSRSELLAVLPELSRSVDGICEASGETPILIMEGEAWSGDKWDGSDVIEFSIVRDLSGFESDLQHELPFSDLSLHSEHPPTVPEYNYSSDMPSSVGYTSSSLGNPTFGHRPSANNSAGGPIFITESVIEAADSVPWRAPTAWGVEDYPSYDGPFMEHPISSTREEGYQHPIAPYYIPFHGLPMADSTRSTQESFHTQIQPPDYSLLTTMPPNEMVQHMFYPNPLPSMESEPTYTQAPASYERHLPAPLHPHHLSIRGSAEMAPRGNHLPDPGPYPGWDGPSAANQYSSIPAPIPEHTHHSYVTFLSKVPQDQINSRTIPFERKGISNGHTVPQVSLGYPYFVRPEGPLSHTAAVSCRGPEVRPVQEIYNPCVPRTIPSEIQALVDAYHDEIPVLIIMALDCSLMPFALPSEYAYSYLGFFRIIDHSNSFVIPPSHSSTNGRENGRVRWHFKFRWEAGGEQFLPDPTRALRPWWSPDLPVTVDGPGSLVSSGAERPKVDFDRRYYSFLPLHLFAIYGPSCSGDAFPRGWRCSDCGKLNEQILLRHRSCSHCKPSGDIGEGFVVVLECVRDPHLMLSMSIPSTHYPDGLEYSAVTWDNDMRTFRYEINKSAFAKHIFTCNDKRLQTEPTLLFEDIQSYVPLLRQRPGATLTSAPYFTYLVGPLTNSGVVGWTDAPACVSQARDFLLHRGRHYGEVDPLSINHLTIMAWITTGRKTQLIKATKSTVTMLCLGADVLLSVAPNLGFVVKDKHGVSGSSTKLDAALPCDGSDMDISLDDIVIEKAETASTPTPDRPKLKKKAKKSGDVLAVTLVHGDILILAGDDFECSIKRTGSSILLIASE